MKMKSTKPPRPDEEEEDEEASEAAGKSKGDEKELEGSKTPTGQINSSTSNTGVL